MEFPIVHFEIQAKDVKETREFYKNLFGWEYEWDEEMKYGMVNFVKGPGGGVMQVEGEMKPGLSVYVGVPSVDEYLEKAKSLGAQIIMTRTEIPGGGAFGMFTDMNGIMMGVFEE